MVDAGVVDAESARHSAFRGVLTRALGVESLVQADAGSVELAPGDRVLLCSDGLTDLVDDARIRDVIAGPESCSAQARQLVAQALDAGGHDNVTAIVARLADPEPPRL
jgi:protein phosphatase